MKSSKNDCKFYVLLVLFIFNVAGKLFFVHFNFRKMFLLCRKNDNDNIFNLMYSYKEHKN